MKTKNMIAAAVIACFAAPAALADHQYVDFDDAGNMVISGPFDAVIPLPEGARRGGPEHSSPSFLDENLKVSKAGYFADDRFVMVQVETTDAGAGTLTNENLPVYKIGDSDFRARTACIDISQEDLDSDSDPLFEFIEGQNVQIVPAVQAVQLSVIADDGAAEGTILYMRNVAGGCAAMTDGFEKEFAKSFERFIESINTAN
jgi:hypothetical protein